MLFCLNKMEELSILTLVLFFATSLMDKAESVKVKLEETPLKTFDELFGEGWWDKDEAEDLKTPPTNFGQNVHRQIDRQNTQLEQIEPNSTDPLGQIEPNSTDQNPPLTQSDHSNNAKNGEEQNEISSNKKRKIVDEFHEMKDEFKQKVKYSKKEWVQIDEKIAKHLKVSRTKIYEWKKEFGLSQKMHNFEKKKNERKSFITKFDQMKAELTRAGFKNSYHHEIDKIVAKELGLGLATIYTWKRELGQTMPNYSYDEKLKIVKKLMQMKKHFDEDKKSCKEIDKEIAERFGVNIGTINQWKKEFGFTRTKHSEQKEMIKRYYEIKDQNPKISDADIAKMLKIGRGTLTRWKRQFKRQQLHPNSVIGHSVEENAAANVQEIEN